MVNSVTKSFLSTVVGLAFQKGLIQSLDDKVYNYVPPIEVYHPNSEITTNVIDRQSFIYPFNTEHNKKIYEQILDFNSIITIPIYSQFVNYKTLIKKIPFEEKKYDLIKIIKENNIDIVHAEEIPEALESFNKMPFDLLDLIWLAIMSKDKESFDLYKALPLNSPKPNESSMAISSAVNI